MNLVQKNVRRANVNMLCQCEYDVIDNYNHDLFLSNDDTTCYYNSQTKQIQYFKEVTTDGSYIYGCDGAYQYIIEQESGQTVYKKKYNQYNKSCYLYCGDTDMGAVFYDATFSTYIYPTDTGYKPYEYPLNNPVIINKRNVLNIVDGENGIGVIDSFGNTVIDNKYDEISLEIKITAKNKNERIEKIIALPNEKFSKERIFPLEKWI